MHAFLWCGFYAFFNAVAFIDASYLITDPILAQEVLQGDDYHLHMDKKPDFVFLYVT